MNRRDFVRTSAAAMTALSYERVSGANERVSLGFIGLGNRGDQVLSAFLEHGDSEIAALCDIKRDYIDYAAERSAGRGARTPYTDYRKLLEQPGLDATVISTPDHWHALMTIQSCMQGLDVYVEKPLSLTVVEGRRMVQAVRKYNRVAQVGTQRRSLPWCRRLAETARTGELGHVSAADAYYIQNEWPTGIGKPPDASPPPDVPYELWLGPAPEVDYNPNRTFYKFRWFWAHSGGQVTNMGVHYLDMIQWSLGQRAPKRVAALGGNFAIDDNREIPDTAKVIWEYDDALVGFLQYNGSGVGPARGQEYELRGTKGALFAYSDGFEIVPEVLRPRGRFANTPLDRETARANRQVTEQSLEAFELRDQPRGTEFHTRNFLDCVKSRETCNADIETGHRSTSATLIGNIALRTGKTLEWDAEREQFTNDYAANSWLHYEYRKPYELPKI